MKIQPWFNEWEETFEYVQCKPELSFMPMELLVRIFSFLNPSDLMCVSSTCKRFLDALQHPKFPCHWIINFSNRYSTQFTGIPFHMFMNWSRKFPSIALHCAVDIDDYTTDEFWSKNGEHIKELHFESGLLSKEEFIFVTKNTRNLEVLKIEENSLFKNWVIERFKYERRVRFNNCYDISLARNNILTTDVFDFIMETSPQIRSLNLSNCLHIMNPPERNKFLDHVLNFIRTNVIQIKALNFSNTTTDDLFLDKLGRIENLQLEELHLTFMGSTKNSLYGLPVLIRSQPYLTKIDLTASPCANDIVVKLIANNMPRMKILSLKKCHNLTDNGVREIQKLNMLESLEISDCDSVTDVGINDGILSGTPKRTLKDLNLGLLQNLTETVIFRLSYFLDHLSVLDLGGISTAVTDESFQHIIRHMRFLRKLNLDSCCKLTDYGFTGVLRDIYERRRHSIRNLKGLQVLRCGGLTKLSDFTLIDAFMFNELKEVYFAKCNFTFEGIQALVTNCTSIEVLDLSDCKSIDDECVKIIATSLPRLTTIKLNNCDKLTSKICHFFYENCRDLRNIFIRNCHIPFNADEHFNYMTSLRKVVT